jgi:trehalose/maltose transport system substrate-binding protein
MRDIITGGATTRPSTITGRHYAEVSRAYYSAVHSVLTGEMTAEKAMADLEVELVKLTGFKIGKPVQRTKPPGRIN